MKNVKTKSYNLLIAQTDSRDLADKVDEEAWLLCQGEIVDQGQDILWWFIYDPLSFAVWERGGYGRLI